MFTYQKRLFALAIRCFQVGLIYQNNVEESLKSFEYEKFIIGPMRKYE